MTALFTPTAGQPYFGSNAAQLMPIRAFKPADVAIANSAVLVNDAALFVPVAANAEYEITVHIIYTASATGLLQIGFAAPASATFDWVVIGLANTVTASDSGSYTALARAVGDTKNLGTAGASTPVVVRVEGRLVTVGTSGNLNLKWAQAVSNSTGTTVKAGSFMVARQIF